MSLRRRLRRMVAGREPRPVIISNVEGLAHLFGCRQGVGLIVSTPRGVEIPLAGVSRDWTVLDVSRLLGEIDALPEVAPGSWRA